MIMTFQLPSFLGASAPKYRIIAIGKWSRKLVWVKNLQALIENGGEKPKNH